MKTKEHILIAYSYSTHGIKGEFSVKLINLDSETLKKDLTIYIKKKSEENFQNIKIESIKYGNKIILKLDGINSKTEADLKLPFEIFVLESDLPELEEDEYYIQDLVGIDVFDVKTDKKVGEVISFYDSPIHTILQIKCEMKIIDVIFNENFIKDVDIENNILKIVVPEEIE